MAEANTRSLYEIKRDAEHSRVELAQTVDRLKTSVTGARDRMAPEAIKARLTDTVVNAARDNPAQAIAIGALAAWPLLRLTRAIPLPLALVGAGLFLTSSKSARDFASTSLQQGRERAHDLRDASAEAMDAATARVADAAGRVAETARATAGKVKAAASDAVTGLTDTSEDVADRAAQWAGHVADQGADIGAQIGAEARVSASQVGAATQEAGRQAVARAADALDWARNNPALIGGLGLAIGAFIASAIPATAVERQIGDTVKGGMKAAAAAQMTRAAGAVVRAAASGFADKSAQTRADIEHDGTTGTAAQASAAALEEDARGERGATGG